ncbi:MAG: hypothetical protein KGK15_11250 [Burkholderiales bacterium]|nr:hypothetical protein [Burkholderiales bacterium]
MWPRRSGEPHHHLAEGVACIEIAECRQRGGEYSLDAPGGIVVNDHLGMVEFARLGLGLAYTVDLLVKADIESGALEEVLAPHLPTKAGLFLYFPVRSQTQPKLRAFIDIATAYWGGRR